MSAQLISNSFIKTIQPRSAKYDVRDSKLIGFLVRVYPSGRMSYVVQYQRGKRITIGPVGVLTPAQARERATQILADVSRGVDIQSKKRGGIPTLSQFLQREYQQWVDSHQSETTRTVQKIRSAFSNFLATPLDQITLYKAEQWRSKRLKVLTPASINRDLGALKALLNRACSWGVIKENPLSVLKPLKVDSVGVIRYLTDEEEMRLFNALENREDRMKAARDSANQWRKARGYHCLDVLSARQYVDHLMPLIELALNTGLRWRELVTLEKQQVNMRQRFISQIGKNGKIRHIPLNKQAYKVLSIWLQQTDSHYVFPSPKDNSVPIGNVKSAWQKLLREAGIKNFRWHDLRHHFASKLVMIGVDLNTVRELLGHADIKMTLRYAHLAPEYKANAVAKLKFG